MRKENSAILAPDPLWYKDAVIYQLHVKTFQDGNGDGIGDFRGLRKRLDYLEELGVTALWLLPFYPSPLRDDGYDIADFKAIHPAYGTLADFKAFLKEAHRRGMRVITELVINHTSDQHPWFQRARKAKPGSVRRDFYVWSDTYDKYTEARIIFQDFESSNWTWDPVAQAYYWHRFYSHQPDLNYDNPKVHEAVFKALDFWMDMGVDGMRLDAIPYLYQREGTNCENLPETHAFLKKLRARMDEKYEGRMFLAEANQWPEDAVEYFGDNGDECHMCFHFPLMPRLYMALHMESRFPVTDILTQTPEIPENCQWAIFLRNHDELTLEMVTDEERDYMYRAYARDPRMRVNLGIRRRLAPLVGNHRRRIEMMNALLLSLPGTPIIYYGDEIGMGDNIYLGDRNGVRTPMQWSGDRNAGFSKANPHKLYLPVIIDPEYHFDVVNVEAQQQNRHSLLWWMRRLLTLRSRISAFSRGSLTFLEPENPRILAFIRRHETQSILVVVNLSRFVQFVELDLSGHEGRIPVEIFGNTPFPGITEDPYFLTLSPHAFYWFSLETEEALRIAVEGATEPDRLPVFDVDETWTEIFDQGVPDRLRKQIPAYIQAQRWFGAKSRRIKTAAFREMVAVGEGEGRALIVFVELQYSDGGGETYILPVAHASAREAEEILEEHPRAAMARVRTAAGGEGFLVDGLVLPAFGRVLMEMIARRQSARGLSGRLTAGLGDAFKTFHRPEETPYEITILKAEQSNTSILYGNRFILKLFRRLQEGTNPDLEIGRFLTRKGFRNLPAVAGSLEYHADGEEPNTLAILQAYVRNEGDAWTFTLNLLSNYFDWVLEQPDESIPRIPEGSLMALARQGVPPESADRIGIYLESARLLAERTAQMHRALASETADPRFVPESFSKLYQRSLFQSMSSLAGQVRGQFQKVLPRLPETVRPSAEEVLKRWNDDVVGRFRMLTQTRITAQRLRNHGDYHLGQVLYTGKDFVIIDFEGEPARPVSERRIKRSPLRDVAGMIRSFHYAVYSALLNEEARGAFRADRRAAMETWADHWYLWISAEYLRCYLESSADAGYLPKSPEEVQVLLDAFLMEKAVYELGYEMNNRPDWVRIPLMGIERLLPPPDKSTRKET